jgi:hypothetical protein
MPTYIYQCQKTPDQDPCPAFELTRPMSESAEPAECPCCGGIAPKAIGAMARAVQVDIPSHFQKPFNYTRHKDNLGPGEWENVHNNLSRWNGHLGP